MGESTGISWTEATWNPWMGCTKVSPGCANCYMYREQRQYGNDPDVVRRSKTKFADPMKWPEGKLVFTCSWSDWFHEAADPWRPEAWEIIRSCPQHTFQILTKRPELIPSRLPDDWGSGYPNVWLGVSIENARHTFRADLLREVPAQLRFISAEPLLGSLYPEIAPLAAIPGMGSARDADAPGEGQPTRSRAGLQALPDPDSEAARGNGDQGDPGTGTEPHETPARHGGPAGGRAPLNLDGFDWVIVGGESGPKGSARPLHPEWAREIRDAVLAVPLDPVDGYFPLRPALHFKQWGSWTPDPDGLDSNGVWLLQDGRAFTHFQADAYGIDLAGAVRMRYAGAAPSSGGKYLDQVDWCEIPERLTPLTLI